MSPSTSLIRYHSQRRRTLLIALIVALLLHGLSLIVIDFLKSQMQEKKEEKFNVKYIPDEKKPEKKKQEAAKPKEQKSVVPEAARRIVETERPKEEDTAKKKKSPLLSEFASKGHVAEGKKSDRSESRRTAVPLNQKKGARVEQKKPEPKPVAKPEKKQVAKKPKKRPEGKGGKPKVIKEEKKVAKKQEEKKVSPLFKKDNDEKKKGMPFEYLTDDKLPMMDGNFLDKMASVQDGKENLSDSDTVSLNTTDYRYASYFISVKRQIELAVVPKFGRGMPGQGVVSFTVNKDGSLASVKILKSSGDRLFDESVALGIREASPFRPFPKSIEKEKLNIVWGFYVVPQAMKMYR